MTLAEHYENKRAQWAVETRTPYDRDLRRIFSSDPRHRAAPPAAAFIRKNRAAIRALAADGADDNAPTLDAVLDEVIARCRTLKLRAPGPKTQVREEVAELLGAKAQAIYGGPPRQWYAL